VTFERLAIVACSWAEACEAEAGLAELGPAAEPARALLRRQRQRLALAYQAGLADLEAELELAELAHGPRRTGGLT
jgi:hypothetical protein